MTTPEPPNLTLRAYIATAAMHGMLGNKDFTRNGASMYADVPSDPTEKRIAERAVQFADALIAELSKP